MLRLTLLIDPPQRGSWNMALDEALLEQADQTGTATLRFYQWNEPTLSLGYFQPHAQRADHAASRTAPLVRRASGGGALVHHHELTYSFTTPISDRLAGSVEQLFYAFHETMIDLLAQWNVAASLYRGEPSRGQVSEPFLCFQRRAVGDLMVQGAKVLGSAQRRRRGAVLQHGGLLLRQSSNAPELPGIEELTGATLHPTEITTHWIPLLAERLSAEVHAGEITTSTHQLATTIEAEKFAHPSWNEKR